MLLQIARLSGEVIILKAQIKSYQKDLSNDFKNIKKRYMDQLIKVKMQDMASGDLEKYAKALDRCVGRVALRWDTRAYTLFGARS